MLLAIRDKTRGWIAYVIVAVLVVPFALFGLYNYAGNGGEQTVASVDGEDITRTQLDQAYRERQAELRQMLGEQFDPGLFNTEQLRREALQQLIDQQLLFNHARTRKLNVSDEQVASIIRNQDIFQVDGEFSMERYRQLLEQNNLTLDRYEAQMRQDLSLGLLRQAIERSAYTSDRELDRILALQGQRRELSWVTIPTAAYRDGINPQPEALEQWYEQNPNRFQLPEQVRLNYLLLDPAVIAERIDVSTEDIRERYRERQAEASQTAERELRHILIEVPAQASADAVGAAREQAVAARERIQAGESFAAVARAVSDDTGSANDGGNLGAVQPSDVAPAFAEAAWKLEVGAISEPVRTDFGWHVIEVTAARANELAPLEELAASLRESIAQSRAERKVFELGNTLETLAFEYPRDLEPAAEALGLPVQQTDWLAADDTGEGILAETAIQRSAFSDALLESRENSDLIDLGDGRYGVIRVVDHRAASREPLADVKADVREAVIDEQAAKKAQAQAEAMLPAIESGQSLRQAAEAVSVAKINAPRWAERNERELPAGVREMGFRLPRPAPGQNHADLARLPDGWAVVLLSAVEDANPDDIDAERRAQLRQSINAMDGQLAFRAVLAQLREQAQVRIFEERL